MTPTLTFVALILLIPTMLLLAVFAIVLLWSVAVVYRIVFFLFWQLPWIVHSMLKK